MSEARQPGRPTHRTLIALTAVVILLAGSSAYLLLGRSQGTPTAGPAPTEPGPTEAAPMEAAPSLGPADAPVTIVEYGDFGCPSCQAWHRLGVLDDLRAKYGDRIRFVWRDFPVITLLSPRAAEAGQCAHEQGKFWEFHDLVYEYDGAIEAADLKGYAAQIGLDTQAFDTCVVSRRYRNRVNAEQHEAFEHGFLGAPSFLIGDRAVIGLQRPSVFEAEIDALLSGTP